MKTFIFLIGLSIFLITCDKPNELTVSNELIIKLEHDSDIDNLFANGIKIIDFKETIPETSSSDLRYVIFTLSDTNFGFDY